MANRDGSWMEYQQLVLSELKRLHQEVKEVKDHMTTDMPSNSDYERLEKDIKELRTETVDQGKEITALQVKAAAIGAGSGLVVSAVVTLLLKYLVG